MCVSLSPPFPYSTELNKVCFGACSGLIPFGITGEKPFCACCGMLRWRPVSAFHNWGCIYLSQAFWCTTACVQDGSVWEAFGEWSRDLWGHFINYICDIQPDEFPLWLNDMMNINDLRWITLLLLLLLLLGMIMCFMTLGERGGKLHTAAHLRRAHFHTQHFRDQSVEP